MTATNLEPSCGKLEADKKQRLMMLMSRYDTMARQLLQYGSNIALENEWTATARKLIQLGADQSWFNSDSVMARYTAFQSASQQHSPREAEARAIAFYSNHDVTKPFPEIATTEQEVRAERRVSTSLAEHFANGNQELKEAGFDTNRPYNPRIMFDAQAMDGFLDLIRGYQTEGLELEDMVVLVGKRVYDPSSADFYAVVNGVLHPAPEDLRRQRHSIDFNYGTFVSDIESCPYSDANGKALASQEMVGLIHIHPTGISNLSQADTNELSRINEKAPGFVLGAVCPGVEEPNTGSIAKHLCTWNSRTGTTKIIEDIIRG